MPICRAYIVYIFCVCAILWSGLRLYLGSQELPMVNIIALIRMDLLILGKYFAIFCYMKRNVYYFHSDLRPVTRFHICYNIYLLNEYFLICNSFCYVLEFINLMSINQYKGSINHCDVYACRL